MPVNAANASHCSMPDSRKNASFVPSPCKIVAFGSAADSSSQRA